MGLSDSRRNPCAVIDSHARLGFAPIPPGLPGSSTDLFTRADPNHPGRPSECLPVASPLVSGFILVGGLATFVFLSRPNRVYLRCGSRVCPYQGFAIMDYSTPRLLGYMSEQAIYMVNTFQFTRSARLILAHRPSGSGSHRCINRVPPSSREYRMALRATKGHENRGRGRYAC